VKFLMPCSQTKQRVSGIAQHIEHHTLPAALSAEYTRVLVLLAAQLLTNTPAPPVPLQSQTPPQPHPSSGSLEHSHLLYTPCSTEGGGQSHAL
jgi:hypothetical protein